MRGFLRFVNGQQAICFRTLNFGLFISIVVKILNQVICAISAALRSLAIVYLTCFADKDKIAL